MFTVVIVTRAGLIQMATLALLAATIAAPSAAADTLVVQPDGKLVLAGRTWFETGAIARLNPDGDIDAGFGEQGFSIDHRLPGLQALAIQPDGRIIAAAAGGSLARYLPGGAIDPSFGAGGIGGEDEPGEVHFIYPNYGPSDLLVQPGERSSPPETTPSATAEPRPGSGATTPPGARWRRSARSLS